MDYRDPVTPAEKIRESLIRFQEKLEDIDKLGYESGTKAKAERTRRTESHTEASARKRRHTVQSGPGETSFWILSITLKL